MKQAPMKKRINTEPGNQHFEQTSYIYNSYIYIRIYIYIILMPKSVYLRGNSLILNKKRLYSCYQ